MVLNMCHPSLHPFYGQRPYGVVGACQKEPPQCLRISSVSSCLATRVNFNSSKISAYLKNCLLFENSFGFLGSLLIHELRELLSYVLLCMDFPTALPSPSHQSI